ncbi:hypothetical protein EDB85DRAFT_1888299 [Lactarius pseudohatsudake]|nr:hypothetical protein EDB85DRAFT_1888299 [Lactarius pseudohatsudake]
MPFQVQAHVAESALLALAAMTTYLPSAKGAGCGMAPQVQSGKPRANWSLQMAWPSASTGRSQKDACNATTGALSATCTSLKRKGKQREGLKRKGKFTQGREMDDVVLHKKSSLPYKLGRCLCKTNTRHNPRIQGHAELVSYMRASRIRNQKGDVQEKDAVSAKGLKMSVPGVVKWSTKQSSMEW